jgi:hypothetical protein
MTQLLPEFLFHRVKRPLDVHPHVPEHIKAMLRYLKEEFGVKGDKEMNELMRKLCKGYTKMFGYSALAQKLCDEHVPLVLGNEVTIYDKITAAMIVGAKNLLRQLLP